MDKYFITGSSYFIEKNIKLYTPKDDDLDLEVFFGDEINREEFLGYINSVDLFGNTKAAVLRNTNKIKDIESLVLSMAKSQECVLLVTAISGEKVDQNLVKLFKSNGFNVLVEEQKKTKATIDDVIRIFKEKNILFNYNQAEFILNKCLNNLSMVENEAEKMEIYVLSRKAKVPVNILLEQISGEKEETIYALTDAFGMRNLSNTLKIYSTMEKDFDNCFKIFFALTRRIYYLYLLYIDESFLKRVPDFQLIKIKNQKKKWKEIELVKILDDISELDKNVKTGIMNIDNAVLSLIMLIEK